MGAPSNLSIEEMKLTHVFLDDKKMMKFPLINDVMWKYCIWWIMFFLYYELHEIYFLVETQCNMINPRQDYYPFHVQREKILCTMYGTKSHLGFKI